jgi:glycosyltransferase involved in cell wall biosynthesis
VNNILISCIIPAYNIEKYIARCLESVISQSLTNLEIIVINDCSTDGTLEIINEYALKDTRIKVITNEKNSGLSYSRNIGLENASGQYIHFLDGDDFIKHNTYEELYKKTLETPLDIIIFDYYKYSEKNGKISATKKRKITPQIIYSTINDKKKLLNSGVVAWNKIYSNKFLQNNNLRFINGVYYEDIPFFWRSIILAEHVLYLNKPFYFYSQRDNSIMKDSINLKKMSDILFVMLKVKKFLIDSNLYQDFEAIFTIKFIKTIIIFYSKLQEYQEEFFHRISDEFNLLNSSFAKKTGVIRYAKFGLIKNRRWNLYKVLFK